MLRVFKNLLIVAIIIQPKIIYADNSSFFVDVNPYRGTVSTIENVVSSSSLYPNNQNNFNQNKFEINSEKSNENNSNEKFEIRSKYCSNINSYNSISPKLSFQERFWIKQGSKGVYDRCGKKNNQKILERATLLNKIIKDNDELNHKFIKKYPKISFLEISENKQNKNKRYYESLLNEIDSLREDLYLETNGMIIQRYLYENLNLKLKSKKQMLTDEEQDFYINYINEIYTIENIENISNIPKYKEIQNSNNHKIIKKIKFLEEINPLLFYYLQKQKRKLKKNKVNIKNNKKPFVHDLSILFNS